MSQSSLGKQGCICPTDCFFRANVYSTWDMNEAHKAKCQRCPELSTDEDVKSPGPHGAQTTPGCPHTKQPQFLNVLHPRLCVQELKVCTSVSSLPGGSQVGPCTGVPSYGYLMIGSCLQQPGHFLPTDLVVMTSAISPLCWGPAVQTHTGQ